MDFDLGLFVYGSVATMIGAASVLLGQAIQKFRTTWVCPECKDPLKFKVQSEDKEAREKIGEHHIRTEHSR